MPSPSSTLSNTDELYDAACSGDIPNLRRLMNMRGVDVNKPDSDGWTALMHAASNGKEEAVIVF